MTSRTPRAAAATLALLMIAGCHRGAPKGQVVATVEGQDVTRRDIAAELATANLPKGVDVATIQPAVVNELVNRKLLVRQAKQQGLDKTPEYLALANRAEELVLAQQLVASWVGKQPAPADADIQAFIAANPQMFADRQVFLLDQVATKAAGLDPKALAPLQTMDAVIAYLKQQNHGFQRRNATLDSATVPAKAVDQIAHLAPGVPFVSTQGGTMVVSAVLQSKPAPVPDEQRAAVATQALKQQNAAKIVSDHIKSLRAGAKIEYQPGFAPPKGAS